MDIVELMFDEVVLPELWVDSIRWIFNQDPPDIIQVQKSNNEKQAQVIEGLERENLIVVISNLFDSPSRTKHTQFQPFKFPALHHSLAHFGWLLASSVSHHTIEILQS